MFLRSDIKENYCHLLNITKAILNAASNNDYNKKISCNYLDKYEFCNNINELFSNTYVEPTSYNIKFVNILQKSIMNTLQCDTINTPSFNYFVIPTYICILFIIFVVLKKIKVKGY